MSSHSVASLEADRHLADVMLRSLDDRQQRKVQPAAPGEAYELSELAEGEYGVLTFDSRPRPGLRRAIIDAWYEHGAASPAFPDHDLHPLTDKVITHGLAHELQGLRPLAVYNALVCNRALFKTAVTLDLDPAELSEFDVSLRPHAKALQSGAYLATLRYLAGEPGSLIREDGRSHFRSQGERIKNAPYGSKLRQFYPGRPKSVFQRILDHADDYNKQAPRIRPTIYEDGEIAAYLAHGFSSRKSRLAALAQLVESDYGESFAFRKRMVGMKSTPALLRLAAAPAVPAPAPVTEQLPETQHAEPSPAVEILVTRIVRNGNTLIHAGRAAQDILSGRQSAEQAIRDMGSNKYLYNPLRDMSTIDLQEVAKRGEESLRTTLEKAHDAAMGRFDQLIADKPELADYLDKVACLAAAMTAAFQKTFNRRTTWNRYSSHSDVVIGAAYSQVGRMAAQASQELNRPRAAFQRG